MFFSDIDEDSEHKQQKQKSQKGSKISRNSENLGDDWLDIPEANVFGQTDKPNNAIKSSRQSEKSEDIQEAYVTSKSDKNNKSPFNKQFTFEQDE